jgi:hypothetical protein
MTESERSEREQRYRGPLPRDPRDDGPLPGLVFDDVTGRVIRVEDASVPQAEPVPEVEPVPAEEPMSAGRPVSWGGQAEEARLPHVPDRAPSREQRRTDGRAMIPLLARALSSQLAQLAADDEPASRGWWFTPDTDR